MQSQARASKLSANELPDKLAQACLERDELARKLHLTESLLQEKVCMCACVRPMIVFCCLCTSCRDPPIWTPPSLDPLWVDFCVWLLSFPCIDIADLVDDVD